MSRCTKKEQKFDYGRSEGLSKRIGTELCNIYAETSPIDFDIARTS